MTPPAATGAADRRTQPRGYDGSGSCCQMQTINGVPAAQSGGGVVSESKCPVQLAAGSFGFLVFCSKRVRRRRRELKRAFRQTDRRKERSAVASGNCVRHRRAPLASPVYYFELRLKTRRLDSTQLGSARDPLRGLIESDDGFALAAWLKKELLCGPATVCESEQIRANSSLSSGQVGWSFRARAQQLHSAVSSSQQQQQQPRVVRPNDGAASWRTQSVIPKRLTQLAGRLSFQRVVSACRMTDRWQCTIDPGAIDAGDAWFARQPERRLERRIDGLGASGLLVRPASEHSQSF